MVTLALLAPGPHKMPCSTSFCSYPTWWQVYIHINIISMTLWCRLHLCITSVLFSHKSFDLVTILWSIVIINVSYDAEDIPGISSFVATHCIKLTQQLHLKTPLFVILSPLLPSQHPRAFNGSILFLFTKVVHLMICCTWLVGCHIQQ